MGRPLILLDLDKTLIDPDYKLDHVQRLWETNEAMEKDDWWIGLNSDTPIARLAPWAEQLALSGPLVTEFGNAVFVNRTLKNLAPFWCRGELVPFFTTLRSKLVQFLMKEFPKTSNLYGDSLQLKKSLLTSTFEVPGPLLILDTERKYSLNCFLFRREQGRWVASLPLLNAVRDFLTEAMKQLEGSPNGCVFVDEEYGICIAHAPGARKRNALSALFDLPNVFEHCGSDRIIMIGDSMSDFLDSPQVIQCAVGNANVVYKGRCDFVAPSHYSAGVLECLAWAQKTF